MSESGSDGCPSGGQEPEWCRYNSAQDVRVDIELFGYPLTLSQDPNSQHLGTTVWDASIVFAKYLEKNSRKKFAPALMKGKTCLELGSGVSALGAIAAAMLGCTTVATDVADVLPMLQHNVTANFNNVHWAHAVGLRSQFGALRVAELDWTKPEQLLSLDAPFDFVFGTDCVYHEHLIHDLLRVALRCTGPKTTMILGNELRSLSVAETFERLFKGHFKIRRIAAKDQHDVFQNPNIYLYLLKRLKTPAADAYFPPATAVHSGGPGPAR